MQNAGADTRVAGAGEYERLLKENEFLKRRIEETKQTLGIVKKELTECMEMLK